MKKRILFAVASFLLFTGCVTDPPMEAFDGEYDRIKEMKVIVGYCQSCHTHADFDPVNHMVIQQSRYQAEPYTKAEDCRTCHDLEKNFWNDYVRTTHFPEGSLTNE